MTNRFYSAIIDYADLRGCWNRQTGKLEVLVSVLACGFKSHFPHQCKGHSIFRVSFIFVLAKTYALQYAEKLWQFHCCHSFQFIEKVCFFKKVLVLNPYPQTPFPGKGAECGAAALTKQGRLKSVAHSRCTMQRHQRLTARIGATPQTPF